jgi:predicted amidophosphoribosyltransferase
MRNTEMICKKCLYRVKSSRGHICEKTGKHLYWNQQDCPDYSETKQPEHKEKP